MALQGLFELGAAEFGERLPHPLEAIEVFEVEGTGRTDGAAAVFIVGDFEAARGGIEPEEVEGGGCNVDNVALLQILYMHPGFLLCSNW